MLLPHWLQQLAQRWSVQSGKRRRRAGGTSARIRRRLRPRLEVLEDRITPSYDVLTFSAGISFGSSVVPNQPSGAIAVQLQDNTGHAITATSNLTVKLSSSSKTGEFLDLSGKQLTNSSLVISAGSSFALFEYQDSQTGNAAITGQTSNPSAFGGTLVEVQNRLAFTTPKQTLTPGQVSPPVTIQLQDANGNAVKAASDVTVVLSSSSSGGKFLDTSGNPLTGNSVTIAAGASSASFEYEDSQEGFANLSASTLGGGSIEATGSQQVNVQYALAFTTLEQNIAPNEPSGPITVQLQDGKGNAVKAASDVSLNLSTFSSTSKFLDTSGTPLPKNSFGSYILTIAAGADSGSFEYEDSQAGFPIISVGSSNGGTTNVEQELAVGQPFIITTPVQTLTPGKASQPITVQLDSAATSNETLDLSSTGTGGQFLDTSGNALANNSITIAAGASSASFEYENSQTGLPTITVEKSDFSASASQAENVGVSLNFTTAPQTVAQGQLSQAITIQLQDSQGQPFTAANVVSVDLLSSNGGQLFDTSGNPLFGLINIAAGSSSASFKYNNQSASGTDTVTAVSWGGLSGTTLLSTSQQETVTAPPYSVAIVSPKQTLELNQPSQPITVQLQSNGSAFTATSNVTINLSSDSSTGKFLDTSGNALANNSITIAAGASTASFEYEDSQEWLPTLTATVSGSTQTGTQSENVGGVSLVFSTAVQTITAGKPSGTITLQFQDSSGNAVKAPSATSIFLSSNSATGAFLDTSGNPLSFGNLTVSPGSSSASFEFKDTVGGKPTLTASVSSFINGGLASPTQQETVTGPYTVQFTASGQTITPNQASQPITVQLRDSTGQPATTSSAVTVNLSSSSTGGQFLDTSGNALTTNSITIVAGSGSASFKYKDSQTGLPTLTASENGFTGRQTENIGLSLAFTTSPQTLKAGTTSQTLTVQLQDSNGNAFKAPSNMTLNLSSDRQGVQFLDTSGNPLPSFGSVSSISIASGSSSASFEFASKWGGTPTLTASTGFSGATGSSPVEITATQKETVQGIAALVFTTSPQTLTVGQTSQLVTLQLEDNNGNAANAPSGGLAINLLAETTTSSPFASSLAPTEFFDANGNPLPVSNGGTTLTMPAGSSTVSFKFQTTTAGTLPLSAAVSNGFSGSQFETIQAGSPSSVVFVAPAQSLLAGTPSGTIAVQLEDKYGNVIQAGSGGLTFNLSSSSNTGQFLSVSGDPLASPSVTIAQGASSAAFEYEDSQSGTPTLTVTASGVPGTQQETITASSTEIHVSNTKDSGSGSLRDAITAADNNPGSSIVFDSGVTGTIDLLSALPDITANTNILGPGANVLTLSLSSSATGAFGGFVVGTPPTALEFVPPPQPIVTISGLTVANFNGTGITNFGSLTLRQVDVSNNQAPSALQTTGSFPSYYGPPGGIGNFSSSLGAGSTGTLTVLDSTIANNSTTNNLVAAGIDSEGGSVIIINSTITGNVDNNSNSAGGVGIYGGTAFIANSTISGNTATQSTGTFGTNNSGGGIDASGAVTLYDTIVAGNTGSLNNPTDVSGTFISLGHNLIGKANSQSKGFVSSDSIGTTTNPIDPKLGALANNGGPTPTMALLTGSPAIAAGSSVNAPATDQRGDSRPQGTIDIGAFEFTTSSSSVAPSITGNPSSQTVTAGQNASFTASASGTPTPTVQWQVSSDGGKTFTNISGATSTSLTLNNVTAAMNGNEYQALFTNSAGSATTSAATLIVNASVAPSITGNPTNQSALAGDNVSFTASASGTPTPTVQWQVSSDGGKTFANISGATNTTLTLNNVITAMNGNEYQAVFTNSAGSATTSAATLTVSATPVAPSITGNPSSQTVTAGTNASFTASASGTPTPTVQWQVSSDGGKTFTNISGATSTSLMLNNVTAAMNGNEYQAVFTNSAGTATSSAATLTVQYAPTVTTNPTSQTVTAGQNATFTVVANGNPTPTVQWQVSSNGGKTFTNISGATSTTLTLNNILASQNSDEYQAVFTNSVGSVASSAAILTVQFAPTVTTGPTNQTVTAGQNATLTAAANGNPTPTVQWQVSTDGGKTFTNLSGATSATLTLNDVNIAMSGNQYQAVFTNSLGSVITSAAALTVQYAPTVTTNPSSQTVATGQNITFTVAANGNPTPTVQWQVSSDGGKTFTNISGATSTTLSLNAVTADMNGNEYQAVFSNSVGSSTTSAATLSVQFAPIVAANPANQTVTASLNATFTAAVNANPSATVQWQVSTDGGKTFTNISGAKSTALTLNNVTTVMSGNQYQAVFTNSLGSITTSAATLTVNPAVAPVITGNPSNQTVTTGHSAAFTASASGSPTPTVQWQVSSDGGKTFINISGATSTTLTLTKVTVSMSGYQYHAVFSNSDGSVTSAAVTLTVHAPPPPVLQIPPLLAFLNSLFGGGTETVNSNGTETVTDSFFGIPLIVSTFDSSGKLVDVTFLGIDITFLVLLL